MLLSYLPLFLPRNSSITCSVDTDKVVSLYLTLMTISMVKVTMTSEMATNGQIINGRRPNNSINFKAINVAIKLITPVDNIPQKTLSSRRPASVNIDSE